jgi:hypothetical protein
MDIIFAISWCGGMAFQIAACFVWALRMQRYVERHGEKTAFLLYSGAGLRDYRTARRIAERTGHKPRFLAWYERLQIAAISFFIIGIVTAALGELNH